MASILGLYAILKATAGKKDDTKSKKKVKVVFRPHEVQVATLFLLLGIAKDKNERLADRMAELGTGEGKSVVLAALCAYLALVGF